MPGKAAIKDEPLYSGGAMVAEETMMSDTILHSDNISLDLSAPESFFWLDAKSAWDESCSDEIKPGVEAVGTVEVTMGPTGCEPSLF